MRFAYITAAAAGPHASSPAAGENRGGTVKMAQAPQPQPQSQPQIQYQYVDRPEVTETFADFVQRIQFDGQTLRLEFAVSRLEDQRPPAQATGKRYPACRLVLSASAAVDLMNKMQQITAGLIKAGVLKQDTPQPAQPTATS
jgi:hypothetical protein